MKHSRNQVCRYGRQCSLLGLLRRIGPREQPGWLDARTNTALSAPRRRARRSRNR
jgi:hypothetical protein